MQIAHIEGASRTLGEAQGYQPLPVRYAVLQHEDGSEVPVMSTAWTPSEKEIEALIKGASIHLHILGTAHPPVRVEVGPVPEEDDNG
jgi:hypothetical protein